MIINFRSNYVVVMAWTSIRRVLAPPTPKFEDDKQRITNRNDPYTKPRLSKQNAATLSVILYFKIINFYDKVPYSSKGRSLPFSLYVNPVRRSSARSVAMDPGITAFCGHWRFLVKCHMTFIVVSGFKILLLNG